MQADRSVGAVVLAAGMSRRYGSPKQLAMLSGRTLLEHVIGAARAAQLEPVVVVVPVWMSLPVAPTDAALCWIRNPFPERGMSLSLRLGLGALGRDTSAAVILLGDQPGVLVSTISAVVAARGDRPLVAALADGVLAPPLLIERTHFSLAANVAGDVGLRDLLRADPDLVTGVAVPTHAPDVDAPDDLGRSSGP